MKVMQSGNVSDGNSVMSDDRKSSGSYTSSALRSLMCMLPFNIGFSSESTTYDQSEFTNDEELN